MKRKEAIKQIQEGKIQVCNDLLPSTKEIKNFLKESFPEDKYIIEENCTNFYDKKYFYASGMNLGRWYSSNERKDLPIINLSTITKRKKTKLSQLEKQFSDLAKDVSELRQTLAKDVEVDVEEVKSELIVGEWYKSDIDGLWFVEEFLNEKYQKSYGFSYKGNWCESSTRMSTGLIPATPQEVQTALENEAKKRGFEERNIKIVNFKCIYNIFTKGYCLSDDLKRLYYNGECIFNEGKFAEIIQQETIKEEEIDWSVPQLLIYEKEESFILMTNGIYTTDKFEAHVILDKKGKSGWEISSFSDKWVKDCFKKFKGELTIK